MVSNEHKPLVDLLTPDMVDIYVGSKRKQYHLHKPLLCHQSEFFKKAFSGDFKESEERALYLPDDDPTAFELFIHWLYTGRLDEPWGPGGRRPYIKLYILASKFCMESLANATIDRLQVFYATSQRHPDIDMIAMIWNDTL
ncbi:MAG: hypothetical protein M1835_007841 [Candelina submexicana]|nr:MAG: hypothetical protein M1835_007841 [Candelina submexicana]